MQVLVLIVQNAVGYEDLGVATSGATFFRSIGASFGVAIFGTIFTSRLGDELDAALAGAAAAAGHRPRTSSTPTRGPSPHCPAALRPPVLHAYATSITDVFLYAVPSSCSPSSLAWFLKEDKLRGSVTAPDVTETLASNPVERSSHDEVRARPVRARHPRGPPADLREDHRRAGYDLQPASSWLLLRVRRHGSVEPAVLADAARAARRSSRRPRDSSRSAGTRRTRRAWSSS